MNKHILFVIDHLANPNKYTKKQLKANALAADAFAADNAAADAFAADNAAAYAAAADYYYDDDVEYWVDEYFLRSGENKQTYIDKLGE